MNSGNILSATDSYTLKWLILYYLKFISITDKGQCRQHMSNYHENIIFMWQREYRKSTQWKSGVVQPKHYNNKKITYSWLTSETYFKGIWRVGEWMRFCLAEPDWL